MTDKMREEFEEKFPNNAGFIFDGDTYVLPSGPTDSSLAIYCLEYRSAWRAWQAAKSVPQYDPSTAEVPPPGQPLQKLGEYLSLILDEDEWATAEQHLLAAWAGFYATKEKEGE